MSETRARRGLSAISSLVLNLSYTWIDYKLDAEMDLLVSLERVTHKFLTADFEVLRAL